MRKLLLLAPLLILAGCKDYGQCLASHDEHRDSYVSYEYAPSGISMSGGIAMGGSGDFNLVMHPAEDWTVCDQWEFPNGRPEPHG